MKDVILFVNLGSPQSSSVSDVRKYLNEFLMDPFVMDIPWILRYLLVKMIIVPFRSPKTAKAYASIWQDNGSPLVIHTQTMIEKLSEQISIPTFWAMTYGTAKISKALKEIQQLHKQESVRLHLCPLFPHYAMSTTQAIIAKVSLEMKKLSLQIPIHTISPFFKHEKYIQALLETTSSYNIEEYDHVLFSFHGLPVRHIHKTDPTSQHCLKNSDCCDKKHISHNTCYKAQVLATTRALAQAIPIPQEKWTLCFQSRLGRDRWLTPNTLDVLKRLLKEDKKKVLLISPSFVADCLETLEELCIQGKKFFMHSGGEKFDVIPCLNSTPSWIEALKTIVLEHISSFSQEPTSK